MRSSILKTSEHSPRLNAFRKSPSSRSLSPLDNCPEKAGRAYVTTDRTIAVNIICRELCRIGLDTLTVATDIVAGLQQPKCPYFEDARIP